MDIIQTKKFKFPKKPKINPKLKDLITKMITKDKK